MSAARRRLAGHAPLLALGLAVAGAAAYVLTYALETTSFLNDEFANVVSARAMVADPAEIFAASGGGLFRGPERLTSVLLALPAALTGSAPDELRASRTLLALAYALVAVPAYALLRGLEVPRWPSAALAAAAVTGPWMVFGATMLNVTLAAPLTVAFVWAGWRAVVRPSLATEAAAVAVAALMVTARVSHAAFFLGPVLAAVAAAWWTRPPGEPLRRLPARAARRNPLILGVALVGAIAVAAIGPGDLAGEAYENAANIALPLDRLWPSLAWTTAVLAIATGFLAVPLGGAWALRQIARPASVEAGAFALIAVATFLLYVYVSGTAGAEQQERYPAPLAALPVVAAGAALFRREAWALGTAAVGALAARAIATQAIEEHAEPLSYFFSPAQLFVSKVVLGRLTVALPGDDQMVTIAAVGMVALAVAVAAGAAWRPVAAGAVAALLAVGAVSGVYTLRKYEPATAPGDLDAVAWVDRATGGEDAVFWNYQWGVNAADRNTRTTATVHFNASVCCGEWRPDYRDFLGEHGRLERERGVPPFVAGHAGYRPLVFAATPYARPTGFGAPMRVERFVDERPRAAAVVRGAADDGAVETWARIVALNDALTDHCLDVELLNPDAQAVPVGYALAGDRGRLRPGEQRWLRARGGDRVMRTGRGDALLYIGEIHYVGCDAAQAR
ncbi:MAG TPA: hypothetical protein VGW75_15820 [Solirubrobacteraceae bacterium]|jgi:hypothetical protein|nr:hypothetical protein [Solirubrobacteraceae bacterium]